MQFDPLLTQICRELADLHGVHTMLLYGSRAHGTATPQSDYDIAGFGAVEQGFRIARRVNGVYLDIFVYPEAALHAPTEGDLRFRGSRILVQRGLEGTAFLDKLEAIFIRGPQPLPMDEVTARRVWAHKMLARIERPDLEADYRRAWLLTALLEDYFVLRGLWFEGPKKALRWLEQHDQPTYQAMLCALKPGAENKAIAYLVDLVAGALDA